MAHDEPEAFFADFVESHMASARSALLSEADARAAAHAAMAAVGLIQRLSAQLQGDSGPEPEWERNDVVRSRHKHRVAPDAELRLSAYFLLQHRDDDGWWSAVVLKADQGTGLQVGASCRIPDKASGYHVGRFPD